MAREFKDSGIEWIGQIPREWSVELIGNNIKEINDKNDDSSEDNALQFKMGSIISKKGGDSKYNPESLAAYTKVKEGDIVINGLNLSFDLISQRVGLVREKGVITSTYLTLRPSSLLHSVFVNYLFKAYDNCKAFHGMGRGLRQILAYRELKNQKLIYPPLPEQQKIADYLDKVCGEVDEMVALQETMIEELKAYKQSVITEAVTKGLNPNVPMKDSGIDWIGEIPEHWEIRRLKYIGVSENGLTYSPKDMCGSSDGGILVLRSSNIKDGKLVFDDNVYVNSAPQILHVKKGDIIICSRNGSAALVGKSAIVEEDMYATFGAFMMRFRSNHNTRYINYLLTAAVTQYKQLFSTTTINQLTKGVFGNLEMPFINSQDEQQSIVSYLDTKCAEIDALIALKQAKIEELKEYKKSVIYEYVTGKKEVC